MAVKSFSEILLGSAVTEAEDAMDVSKEDAISILSDLSDAVDSPTESELCNLLISLIKMDAIAPEAFGSLYDAADQIMELEMEDQDGELDYEDEEAVEDVSEEIIAEAMKPMYKRAGYVKCPNGMIRKRGNCGKKIDKKRSKLMMRVRRANRAAYKKGIKKAMKTKKKLGQVK